MRVSFQVREVTGRLETAHVVGKGEVDIEYAERRNERYEAKGPEERKRVYIVQEEIEDPKRERGGRRTLRERGQKGHRLSKYRKPRVYTKW